MEVGLPRSVSVARRERLLNVLSVGLVWLTPRTVYTVAGVQPMSANGPIQNAPGPVLALRNPAFHESEAASQDGSQVAAWSARWGG